MHHQADPRLTIEHTGRHKVHFARFGQCAVFANDDDTDNDDDDDDGDGVRAAFGGNDGGELAPVSESVRLVPDSPESPEPVLALPVKSKLVHDDC